MKGSVGKVHYGGRDRNAFGGAKEKKEIVLRYACLIFERQRNSIGGKQMVFK